MALDSLVSEYIQQQRGVRETGERIRDGGTAVAVAFVDLAGSTALKSTAEPAEWLGYVHQFFETVTGLLGEGRIVKRIGDELLLSFEAVEECARFLDRVQESDLFEQFPCKVGADYGACYHLQFATELGDDPYGQPVDRCARLTALAEAGVILCSADFVAQIEQAARYFDLGEFAIKGFSAPQKIYAYLPSTEGTAASYLQPIISRLEQSQIVQVGYRWQVRQFQTRDFVRREYEGHARPFLARELLRVPALPYTPRGLHDRLRESITSEAGVEFVGYCVDWEAEISAFNTRAGGLTMVVGFPGIEGMFSGIVWLTPETYEAIRHLPKDTPIRLRALIDRADRWSVQLNYAEIVVVDA